MQKSATVPHSQARREEPVNYNALMANQSAKFESELGDLRSKVLEFGTNMTHQLERQLERSSENWVSQSAALKIEIPKIDSFWKSGDKWLRPDYRYRRSIYIDLVECSHSLLNHPQMAFTFAEAIGWGSKWRQEREHQSPVQWAWNPLHPGSDQDIVSQGRHSKVISGNQRFAVKTSFSSTPRLPKITSRERLLIAPECL